MVDEDESVTDPGTSTEEVTEPVVTETENNDPPYKKELEQFPTSFQPMAEEIFKEWDRNVQERFTKQKSQYEPWDQIAKEADPDTVQQALALAQYMEANPQQFVEALTEHYGLTKKEAAAVADAVTDPSNAEDEVDLTTLPKSVRDKLAKIDQLEEGFLALSNKQTQQESLVQQEALQHQLDAALNNLHEKYGDFDDDYVLTKTVANGGDLEAAVEAYFKVVPKVVPSSPAPKVMGSGGGAPAGDEVDVTKMNSKDTRQFVASVLAKSKDEG